MPEADGRPPREGLGGKAAGPGVSALPTLQNPPEALSSPKSRTLHHSHTNGRHSVPPLLPARPNVIGTPVTTREERKAGRRPATSRQNRHADREAHGGTWGPRGVPHSDPTATALPALGAGSRRSAGSPLRGGARAGGRHAPRAPRVPTPRAPHAAAVLRRATAPEGRSEAGSRAHAASSQKRLLLNQETGAVRRWGGAGGPAADGAGRRHLSAHTRAAAPQTLPHVAV